jgi:hypothetical protein
MSDHIPIKLPGSLDSLVKFAMDFQQLKRNLEFIADWMNSTQQVIQDLQNKVEINKPKLDFDPKMLPNLDFNLKLCLKEIDSMNRLKEKINSWSDRFLTIEEKYYGLQGIIKENSEEVNRKIEKESENIIQRFGRVKNEVKEEVRDILKVSDI